MEGNKKYYIKVSVSIVGLLGAIAFTFSRLFDDSPSRPSAPAVETTEVPRSTTPAMPSPEKSANSSNPEPDKSAPSKKSEMSAQPLQWADYLAYDPFEGRGQPNKALYALALEPSPFFTNDAPLRGRDPKNAIPSVLQQLALSGVLVNTEKKLAVINGRAHGVGDKIGDPAGNPLQDPEYGTLEIFAIEAEKIVVKAGGRIFPMTLPNEGKDFVRELKKNLPKSQEKKTE